MNSSVMFVAVVLMATAEAGVSRRGLGLGVGIQLFDPFCKLTEIGTFKTKPDGSICVCSVAMSDCVNVGQPNNQSGSIPPVGAPLGAGVGINLFDPFCGLLDVGKFRVTPDGSFCLCTVAMSDCVGVGA